MIDKMRINPIKAENFVDYRTERKEKAKPFVKWVGGKNQLVEELKTMIETGGKGVLSKYCEPMVGGGALFFSVLSEFDFEKLYIGDTNAELVNAYSVIKNNVIELIEILKNMQADYLPMDESGRKFYYYSVRDKFNSVKLDDNSAVEKAALFIFLNKTCYNGLYRVNKKGRFNVPMGAFKNPKICDEENLESVHNALKNVTVVCGDYSLSKAFIDKNTFVYIDPPYRPISRTSGFTAYNNDAFDDKEQLRLAGFIDEIDKIGAKVVLSNSDPKNINPEDNFFDELYSRYKIKRVTATRMINSKSDGRGKINELLISN